MLPETSTSPELGRAIESGQAANQAPAAKPSRRFALSLRALMIAVLVLGAWLGWFVRNARIQHDAVAAFQRVGGRVYYDVEWKFAGPSPYDKPWTPMRLLDGKLWGTKWLIDHVGIDYFGSVVTVDLIPSRINDAARANDATMAFVAQLSRLDSLRLTGTAVTDAGLVHLKGLTGLEDLELGNTQITDVGLAQLKSLTALRQLLLFNTSITDAGLSHLKELPNLALLDLSRTKVTDDGVIELERFSSLPNAAITDPRHRELRRASLFIPIQIMREEDSALSDAQPRALQDLDFALSKPIRLSSLLLTNRVQVMADRGQKAELIATCNAVCRLNADDKFSLLKLAQTCAACIKSLENPRVTTLSPEQRQALKDRCADRGISALTQAVELGLRSVPHLEDYRLVPLHGHPGFKPLVEKINAATAGN
jgi:hypothetical protein